MGGPLSRRRILGMSAMALGLTAMGAVGCGAAATSGTGSADSSAPPVSAPSPVSAPPPVGVLGANFNGSLDAVDFAGLANVSATWLRGFYPMQYADQGNVSDQPGMRNLGAAVERGYGTVLSLKFAYDKGLPTPGSGEMTQAFDRLDKVLTAVMGKVDILVVGNEPFYECGGKTANLNAFYEALAQHAIDYRQQHAGSGKTQIYLGALTGLEEPGSQNALTARWLDFVRSTSDIAGTDCHPHVPSVGDCHKYLDYIVPQLRDDQKFLATEFSLVKLWAKHLKDPVTNPFADKYHIPRGTPVWRVARNATEHHFTQEEWNEFLLSCPWFANNKQCMSEMVQAFRRTNRFAVAAYGISQDMGAATDFGPSKKPWIFNSIFCPETVQPESGGLPGQNTTWAHEFRSLQNT
jgi:hypothetical protein